MASITFEELINEGQTDWEGLLERVGDGPAWAPLEKGDYFVEIVDVEVETNSRVLGQWSLKHSPEGGGPTSLHAGCGAEVHVVLQCTAGHPVVEDELVLTS